MSNTWNAETVWGCLESAIKTFNNSKDQKTLLCSRCESAKTPSEHSAASERAITYRLAYYLERELRQKGIITNNNDVIVDCEYNRHLSEVKSEAAEVTAKLRDLIRKLRSKEIDQEDGTFYVFSVAPDIIVHERFTDKNYLVIEVKKQSNDETDKYDELKLQLFTAPKQNKQGYGYSYGAWVLACDKGNNRERKLCIVSRFEAGCSKPYAENVCEIRTSS